MVVVWIAFLVFIFFLLALDLGVFHRKAHVVSVREALTWTCVWVVLALAFSGFVYLGYEHRWLGLGMTPDPVDRSAAFPDGRINDGWSAFSEVHHRLRRRGIAQRRQRVRHRDAVSVLRCAA
jgi:hypothetical protein